MNKNVYDMQITPWSDLEAVVKRKTLGRILINWAGGTLMMLGVVPALAGNLPQKKAESPKEKPSMCELDGKKGYWIESTKTCVVVSGYISATVGTKKR